MSRVWISTSFVSVIGEEVTTPVFVLVVIIVAASTHCCVVCCHFIWFMSFFQGQVECWSFTLLVSHRQEPSLRAVTCNTCYSWAHFSWCYGWSKWEAKGDTIKFWGDVTGESLFAMAAPKVNGQVACWSFTLLVSHRQELSLRAVTHNTCYCWAHFTWCYGWSKWEAKGDTIVSSRNSMINH